MTPRRESGRPDRSRLSTRRGRRGWPTREGDLTSAATAHRLPTKVACEPRRAQRHDGCVDRSVHEASAPDGLLLVGEQVRPVRECEGLRASPRRVESSCGGDRVRRVKEEADGVVPRTGHAAQAANALGPSSRRRDIARRVRR